MARPKITGKPCKNCGGTERYSGSYNCVACTNRRSDINKKTAAYKAVAKAYWMTKRYGMTPKDMAESLKSQNGLCACCGTDQPGHKRGWVIDHDHCTGAVRGILCHGCNVGLGGFNDDLGRLEMAINYLLRHDQKMQAANDLPLLAILHPRKAKP